MAMGTDRFGENWCESPILAEEASLQVWDDDKHSQRYFDEEFTAEELRERFIDRMVLGVIELDADDDRVMAMRRELIKRLFLSTLDLNHKDFKLCSLMVMHPNASRQGMADAMGVSRQMVSKRIRVLVDKYPALDNIFRFRHDKRARIHNRSEKGWGIGGGMHAVMKRRMKKKVSEK